jgi:dolichol-phosphate hexosyltransferase
MSINGSERRSTDITVVIPAKDEGPSIADIVRHCLLWTDDVVVVDGHSTDDTVSRARAAGASVVFDRGRGKGDAIRSIVGRSNRPIVVFIDADGSHDPADIPMLVAPIRAGTADHVSASRLMGGSSELHGGFDEFFRLAGSAFITACINWRFGVQLSDSQNGFRAIRAEVLANLELREDSTTIEQEMVMKTLARGFRLGEVPSHEYRRKFGRSHINVRRVAVRYLSSLLVNLAVRRQCAGTRPAEESLQVSFTGAHHEP